MRPFFSSRVGGFKKFNSLSGKNRLTRLARSFLTENKVGTDSIRHSDIFSSPERVWFWHGRRQTENGSLESRNKTKHLGKFDL